MKRLTLNTKKDVLDLLLNTAGKRLVAKNKISQSHPDSPCYACIKAYLASKTS
jgi:hypothetical protein